MKTKLAPKELNKLKKTSGALSNMQFEHFSKIEVRMDAVASTVRDIFKPELNNFAPTLLEVFSKLGFDGYDVTDILDELNDLNNQLIDAYADGMEPGEIEGLKSVGDRITTWAQSFRI
jgi:hypothetical protein